MIKSVIKLSKKSLAILIALLMIISVMPFTPPISVEAADKTAAEYQTSIDTIFAKIGTTGYTAKNPEAADKSYSSSTTFAGDEMSNVLYTYGVGGNAAYISNSKTDVKAGAQYGPVVFLYDGGKMAVPVNFFGIKTARAVARFLEAAWPTTSGFTLKHNWHGSNSSSTGYQTGTSKSFRYQDPKSEIYDRNSNVDTKKNYYYSNTLYYEGTLSDTTEYVSEYVSWGWRLSGSALGSDAFKFNDTSSFTMNDSASNTNISGNPTINVVNYKPIKNILPKVKKEYEAVKANVASNPNYYTEASLTNYYQLVYNVISLDPNDPQKYDYASDAAGQAKKAGEDIAAAAKAYTTTGLVRRQYGVTFVTNDETSTTTYYEVNTPAISVTKPANTAATKIDENSHYTYSWPIVSDVTADATYYEEKNKVAHSYTNKYTSGDTATVECSICKHTYNLSYEAYNAKLTILQDKLADTERYTSSSIVAATKAMNAVIDDVNNPIKQNEVNSLVERLITAESMLELKTFNITYNVYLGEDKTKLEHTEELKDVPYGESKVLTIPSEYQTGYAVTKWTRTIKSSDSIIGTTTSSLTIIANSNASYNVFIKSTANPVDTKMVTATLNNKSNKVVDVAYVNKGINTVSINNSSITLTNGDSITTLTAPSYSFYNVSGFTVNDLPVSDGSSVEINDTTVIRPIYDVKDHFTVLLDTNVKTNKGETGSVEKGWDERITVTADDADENTQWLYQYQLSDGKYSKAEVIGYGKTVSLQVTQSCKISYNNDQNAQPQVSMDYVSYNVYKAKTITAVGRYYLPENCTKVRAGVILKTSNQKKGSTNKPSWVDLSNKDNYKITNKSGVFEATSFVNGTNQYAINFYSSSDYQTMYIGAVAYLTYTDASGEHTIYSDIATYEYNASAE